MEMLTEQIAPRSEGVLSRGFLRDYVITMRPYLLFVSGITGIVGLALAPDIPLGSTLLLGLAFFLSYGFGQALTDCFQLDTDSLSAPYRPLVQGRIRRGDVMVVSLAGLTATGLLLAFYNRLSIPLAAIAIVGLVTYTSFKRRWWAGPFYNAWIVALLMVIAYLSALGRSGAAPAAPAALAGTLLAVFFGYANFVLTGYYKDISADRATGYRTLPVLFGLKISSVVSDIFAFMTLLGCAVVLYGRLSTVWLTTAGASAALFLIGGTVASVLAQVRIHAVKEETQAHRAIGPVVHAYILLLSGLAALQKPHWAPALLLFYVGFLIVIRRRPMREQI